MNEMYIRLLAFIASLLLCYDSYAKCYPALSGIKSTSNVTIPASGWIEVAKLPSSGSTNVTVRYNRSGSTKCYQSNSDVPQNGVVSLIIPYNTKSVRNVLSSYTLSDKGYVILPPNISSLRFSLHESTFKITQKDCDASGKATDGSKFNFTPRNTPSGQEPDPRCKPTAEGEDEIKTMYPGGNGADSNILILDKSRYMPGVRKNFSTDTNLLRSIRDCKVYIPPKRPPGSGLLYYNNRNDLSRGAILDINVNCERICGARDPTQVRSLPTINCNRTMTSVMNAVGVTKKGSTDSFGAYVTDTSSDSTRNYDIPALNMPGQDGKPGKTIPARKVTTSNKRTIDIIDGLHVYLVYPDGSQKEFGAARSTIIAGVRANVSFPIDTKGQEVKLVPIIQESRAIAGGYTIDINLEKCKPYDLYYTTSKDTPSDIPGNVGTQVSFPSNADSTSIEVKNSSQSQNHKIYFGFNNPRTSSVNSKARTSVMQNNFDVKIKIFSTIRTWLIDRTLNFLGIHGGIDANQSKFEIWNKNRATPLQQTLYSMLDSTRVLLAAMVCAWLGVTLITRAAAAQITQHDFLSFVIKFSLTLFFTSRIGLTLAMNFALRVFVFMQEPIIKSTSVGLYQDGVSIFDEKYSILMNPDTIAKVFGYMFFNIMVGIPVMYVILKTSWSYFLSSFGLIILSITFYMTFIPYSLLFVLFLPYVFFTPMKNNVRDLCYCMFAFEVYVIVCYMVMGILLRVDMYFTYRLLFSGYCLVPFRIYLGDLNIPLWQVPMPMGASYTESFTKQNDFLTQFMPIIVNLFCLSTIHYFVEGYQRIAAAFVGVLRISNNIGGVAQLGAQVENQAKAFVGQDASTQQQMKGKESQDRQNMTGDGGGKAKEKSGDAESPNKGR